MPYTTLVRSPGQDLGRLDQLLGRLLLALGVDDLGPAIAFRLRLARDGANHALVDVDMLDFDIGDLDAPGVGLAVRSEEHTSELQSLMRISYAVFCLKKNRT